MIPRTQRDGNDFYFCLYCGGRLPEEPYVETDTP